jgi:hypothetical protein
MMLRMKALVRSRCCQCWTLMRVEMEDVVARNGADYSLVDKLQRCRMVECFGSTFYLASRTYGRKWTTLLGDPKLLECSRSCRLCRRRGVDRRQPKAVSKKRGPKAPLMSVPQERHRVPIVVTATMVKPMHADDPGLGLHVHLERPLQPVDLAPSDRAAAAPAGRGEPIGISQIGETAHPWTACRRTHVILLANK